MKNNKLLVRILVILIIIAVTLIAFCGIYVKDKNTTKNIVKENLFGMNLQGYRLIILDPSIATEKVYYNSEGNEVESSEALDDDSKVKEGYTETEEYINKEETLTAENFEKMKKIIENRLERLGVSEYNIKLDKWTGQIIVELLEESNVDEIISCLTYKGQFAVIDADTEEVLISSNNVKDVDIMYADQTTGTAVYLNIELDKEGKQKLKEISSTYVHNHDDSEETNETEAENTEAEDTESEEEEEKQITIQVENQDLLTTSFDEQLTDGIIPITMGTATTNSELSEYLNQARIMSTIIGSGESELEYSISENTSISPTVSKDTVKTIAIITICIIVVGFIFWIIKYRLNGLYGAISYIGAISVLNLLLRCTNVIISLETIVAIYTILIINYMLITAVLKFVKQGKNIKGIFMDLILSKLNIIIPVCVIAVIFTFMSWLPIFSIGMTLFWGIISIVLSNYLFTKNLLKEEE